MDEAKAKALKGAKGLNSIAIVLDVLDRTASMDFDAALAVERAAFDKLRCGEQATALRYQFFAERQALQIPEIEGFSQRLSGMSASSAPERWDLA